MNNANELRQMLRNYTGSEQVYRHSLARQFNYTEGARAFFRNAGQGAYWLSDILATEPSITRAVQQNGFMVVALQVEGTKAQLKVAYDLSETTDAHGKTTGVECSGVVFERIIDHTDCPEGIWKFYLTWTQVGGSEVVLCMLPSEY